jgi:hypothetical protein
VWLSFGFRNKPVAAVGYSGGIGGGIRAIEHLAHVFIEAEAVPLRNTVVLPFVGTAFGDQDEPADPATGISLQVMLDDLAWWSAALEKARAGGNWCPVTSGPGPRWPPHRPDPRQRPGRDFLPGKEAPANPADSASGAGFSRVTCDVHWHHLARTG